ncbi:Trans-L-3-hydroxyproline dehydratase [Cyphellophora attinorum]|uniref:trans-L-3-hydroxyproline dehydratase n=1 Tax=Cyphellophora attinorum TaxID=1664694 RepID=A0A0N1HSY8_9EURO|nr:Trans-L-3-hydroxyproline dehydratase [Phialophora attinorum]KPI41900.1 Trans-L-3-hydroxyproline dehydratase [Phialophora attinorum]
MAPLPPVPLQLQTESIAISCMDMHTTGEPTRIVYAGYPELRGTLTEQRAQALAEHDHIRRRLMWEPRGHFDMYGAILRPDTELTASGQAHIGVLFTTNEGYSTMCGHATIALGRFLVDCKDESVFSRQAQLQHDTSSNTAILKLHAPCGLLEVTVPTRPTSDGGFQSDPSRPVSFISVPSFATGISVNVPIPVEYQWLELFDRDYVTVDFAYGGAFYCFVTARELGFSSAPLTELDISRLDVATRNLKAAITTNPALSKYYTYKDDKGLSFLYSILIVVKAFGVPAEGTSHAEAGMCFFADGQIDRSPTGSAVAARIALAVAKRELADKEKRTYHSLVSLAMDDKEEEGSPKRGKGAFVGSVHKDLGYEVSGKPAVEALVQGYAYYTGYSTYVVEDADPLGDDGFIFRQLSKAKPESKASDEDP